MRRVSRNETNVRMRAYGGVLSIYTRRVHGSCLDAKSVREKKLHG